MADTTKSRTFEFDDDFESFMNDMDNNLDKSLTILDQLLQTVQLIVPEELGDDDAS